MRAFLLLNLEMLVRKLFPYIPNNRFILKYRAEKDCRIKFSNDKRRAKWILLS